MNNFNDAIGNRTRDVPACRAVPQLIAQPRETDLHVYLFHGCLLSEKRLYERQVSCFECTDTYAVRFRSTELFRSTHSRRTKYNTTVVSRGGLSNTASGVHECCLLMED
jgi:hypothetical protein